MLKIILFSCLFLLNIFAADNASELLNSVQQKYNSASDMSAEFQKSTNGKTDLNGKIFYKKENKVRLELNNLTIVSDGETNWNYNKKENKVIISEYDDSDPSALSINTIIFDYPSQCKVDLESDNILVLTPEKNSGLRFKQIKLHINSENLINKVQIRDQNNSNVELNISGYKLNQNLANSQFTLTPPEGSSVIDLR